MGNGHAPGTATGRGMVGVGAAITGFNVSRRWIAGLAVFFFAAFLSAGFLAGFFLPGFVIAPGFFLPGFPAAAFFPPDDLRAIGFRAAALLADFGADFFLVAFFFAAFFSAFFAAFFAFAMVTSDCVHGCSSCRCC